MTGHLLRYLRSRKVLYECVLVLDLIVVPPHENLETGIDLEAWLMSVVQFPPHFKNGFDERFVLKWMACRNLVHEIGQLITVNARHTP